MVAVENKPRRDMRISTLPHDRPGNRLLSNGNSRLSSKLTNLQGESKRTRQRGWKGYYMRPQVCWSIKHKCSSSHQGLKETRKLIGRATNNSWRVTEQPQAAREVLKTGSKDWFAEMTSTDNCGS